jgi:uncharacterized delta-60 repeat protein
MSKIFTLAFVLLLHLNTIAQTGVLNTSFNGGAFNTVFSATGSQAEDVAIQPNGKPVVAGLTLINNTAHVALARYNVDGTMDASFGTTGRLTFNCGSSSYAKAVGIQADGKIVIAGSTAQTSGDFYLKRINSDGSIDASFGNNGEVITDIGPSTDIIKDIVIRPDGIIIVAGETYNGSQFDIVMAQYNSDGSFIGSTTLAASTRNDFVKNIRLQQDGKVLMVGTTYNNNNAADVILVRFLAEGLGLDQSFGNGGMVVTALSSGDDHGKAVAVQPDGKIVVAATMYRPPFATDIALIRYTTHGTIDYSFGMAGFTVTDIAGSFDDAAGLTILSNGKILVGGGGVNVTHFDFALLRYNSNGSLDGTFGQGGKTFTGVGSYDDIAYGFACSGINVYLVGISHRQQGGAPSDFAVASYLNDVTPLPLRLFDFNAQRAERAVLLQWETDSEENVDHFLVERSADGRTFTGLTKVSGRNTASRNQYRAEDGQPFASTGFYRLKAVDRDGSFIYSKIVTIKSRIINPEVYPNPAHSTTQLQLPSGIKGRVRIEVVEANGRIVHSQQMELQGNGVSVPLNVSSYAKGMYLVQVRTGDQQFTQKLMKE